MKASTTLLLPLLAATPALLVSAQSSRTSPAQPPIPSCAQSCLQSAKPAIGCTVSSDFACACRQPDAMTKGNLALMTGCVLTACGVPHVPTSAISQGVRGVCACATAAATAAAIAGAGDSGGGAAALAAAAATTPVAVGAAATGAGAGSDTATATAGVVVGSAFTA